MKIEKHGDIHISYEHYDGTILVMGGQIENAGNSSDS